jgi:dTDP-4-dehydrorhamnose 3,5-epimerase
MKITDTNIAGVHIVTGDPRGDHRGLFMRLFCEEELKPVIGGRTIKQVNFSRTEAVGAIRGLHYQRKPHAELKMIRCFRGRVFDVAVDLRKDSPTFLQWHAEELSPESAKMMIVPEGCAHGFQVLEPGSELLYLHTEFYAPSSEGGISWNDPALGIRWPLPPTDMSARDRGHPPIAADFKGLDA